MIVSSSEIYVGLKARYMNTEGGLGVAGSTMVPLAWRTVVL